MNQTQLLSAVWRSLKEEYDKVDQSVPPVEHARRMVTIKSKDASDIKLNYLEKPEIITQQIEPTLWVSSAMYPFKPNGEVQVSLDLRYLNQAITHKCYRLRK